MPASAWDNRGVSVYRDEGVVLRTHKLGEADRIVTLLTREHGRVRAVAKGVRRTSSRSSALGSSRSATSTSSCTPAAPSTSSRQVETLARVRRDPRRDYGRYTAGTAMLETAERLTPRSASPRCSSSCCSSAACARWPRASTTRGWCSTRSCCGRCRSPAGRRRFDDCARCGGAGPHGSFHRAAGGVLCAGCRQPGSATPAPTTLGLLSALLTGDWATADGSDARAPAGGVRPGRRVPAVAPRARPARLASSSAPDLRIDRFGQQLQFSRV